MNELKVFVDLASISAGENDMDVDRVACFHDTVHGYSSLLYELRQESGFEDFMCCLKKLWRALDSDENLPKKLVSSAGAGPLLPLVLLLSKSGWKVECTGQIALVWGHHRSSCYWKKNVFCFCGTKSHCSSCSWYSTGSSRVLLMLASVMWCSFVLARVWRIVRKREGRWLGTPFCSLQQGMFL